MYRISKKWSFDAAHQLHGLPEGHKCARMHGHTYGVSVQLACPELSGPGFVTDFADLGPLGEHLNNAFDHRTLNDVLDIEPTSENLAKLLVDWCLANLTLPTGVSELSVTVAETPSTSATYIWSPS